MAKNKDTEMVRIKTTSVNKVRKVKKKTGVPIGRLIEDAIDQKYSPKVKPIE